MRAATRSTSCVGVLCFLFLALGAGAVGCGPDDLARPELPPPIPGDACTPDEQRCASEDPRARQVCRADGRGWLDVRCPTGATCNPTTGACASETSPCEPGQARCDGNPGTAARSICSNDGSGWIGEPCANDLVCDPSTGACAQPVCEPGETRCDGGPADSDRSTCAASRLSFVSTPCAAVASCFPTQNGSKCVNRICEPGAVACSSDFTSVLSCDDSGTAQSIRDACAEAEACMGGACTASATPLGAVVVSHASEGPVQLSPGHYAMAVVDTDASADDHVPWPVLLQGAVHDAPGLGSTQPPAAEPAWQSGTIALMLTYAKSGLKAPISMKEPGGGVPRVRGPDERVFHVPAYDTGATVVYARTARLRAAGKNVNLWEDQTVGAPGALIPDTALSDLLVRIDDAVAPRVSFLLGPTTDVDGNGKIDILFTDLLPTSVAAFVHPMGTLFTPGSGTAQFDHGEVIYTQGLTTTMTAPHLATLVAHELAHLVYFGRRLTPYLGDPTLVPSWIDADVYAIEGLASMAMGWSGQTHCWPMVEALRAPEELSLWRLMSPTYLQEPHVNLALYGYGALVHQYLVDQMGGVKVQGAGSVLVDNGGLAHLEAFVSQQQGWTRLDPGDGRDRTTWYSDMAAAMLVTTLDGKLSAATLADGRYRFGAAVQDPVFGGWLGPTLYGEQVAGSTGTGAILQRRPWSLRPTQLRRGGMAFVGFSVGEAGASLEVSGASSSAVLIRYVD